MDNYSLLSSEPDQYHENHEMREFAGAGADVQLFGGANNRRESQGSMPGEARVQFALSQTPPVEPIGATPPPRHMHQSSGNVANTSANHTLSPVIQCFQNDK